MSNKKYISGTYTGKGKGIGELSVNLTVDDSKIKSVRLNLANETSGVGKDADKQLTNQILQKQSADIDGVTGASLTTRGVKEAVSDALEQAEGKKHELNFDLSEGHYIGKGIGHGGELKVELSVFDNRIGDLKVISNHETPNVGDNAMKIIPKEIVDQQTLNVDAVTGASLTSKAIITAAGDAIEQANGDVRSFMAKPFTKIRTINPEKVNVDVAIAGSGLSGLATAVFAIKKGLKVALVDKNDQVAGSSRYAGAIFALANSERIKELGKDAKIEDVMNFVDRVNENATKEHDREFLKRLLEKSGKTFDELVTLTNTKAKIFSDNPIVIASFTNGAHLAEMLANYIREHGGQFYLNSRVTKIINDGTKVTGIRVSNNTGEFTISAKAVVIATGGASYEKDDLLDKITPSVTRVHVFNEANPANTGDGYNLLKDVNAEFSNNDVYKNGTIDFAPQLFITWDIVPDYSKAMLIDENGKRFSNEAPYNFLNLTTEMYKHGSEKYYLIYDGEKMDPSFKAKLDQVEENSKVYVHADSIDELANKLNIDSDNLKDTFVKYQNATETGEDEFGKDKAHLEKFTGNDFYAVYAMPGSWGTTGGVKINHNTFAVKHEDGRDFDNLYAVGEMSTSDLFSEYYMGGFSFATYTTEGRLLAEQLVKKLY